MHLTQQKWKLLGRPRVKVLLDGHVVGACIEAHEEEGYAVCAIRGPVNGLAVDDRGRTKFTRVYGKVFIAVQPRKGSSDELREAERLNRYLEEFKEAS